MQSWIVTTYGQRRQRRARRSAARETRSTRARAERQRHAQLLADGVVAGAFDERAGTAGRAPRTYSASSRPAEQHVLGRRRPGAQARGRDCGRRCRSRSRAACARRWRFAPGRLRRDSIECAGRAGAARAAATAPTRAGASRRRRGGSGRSASGRAACAAPNRSAAQVHDLGRGREEDAAAPRAQRGAEVDVLLVHEVALVEAGRPRPRRRAARAGRRR